jgi:hypothetical protein
MENQFEFDDRAAWEAESRGLLDYVIINFGKSKYRVSFFTPDRLKTELMLTLESGGVCVGEPGIIIIPKIDKENMEKAIEYLVSTDFFGRLKSL